MTRRGRRVKGQAATGAATDTNGWKAQRTEGAGANSRQPKNMAPKPAADNSAPGTPLERAGTHRATPSAQGIPVNNANSQNRPPRGAQKPRGPRVDPRNLLYANNERLWDPSKGIKMTPKQSPTESQRDHCPDLLTTLVKGKNRTRALNMEDNGENIPASAGTVNRFRASPPQRPLETSYIVEETYDPDSFDRGRTVHRKTSPRPNRKERRRRERERQEELQREQHLIKAKNHWVVANIDDFDVQEQFEEVVRNMQEEQEARIKNQENDSENDEDEDRMFEQPIPPPSHALLEYKAHNEDKLLGRFVNYPDTASGRQDHNVHPRSSLVAQIANMTLTDGTITDTPVIRGRDEIEAEEEDSLDAFFISLHKDHVITSITPDYDVKFAGMGAQFS